MCSIKCDGQYEDKNHRSKMVGQHTLYVLLYEYSYEYGYCCYCCCSCNIRISCFRLSAPRALAPAKYREYVAVVVHITREARHRSPTVHFFASYDNDTLQHQLTANCGTNKYEYSVRSVKSVEALSVTT